VYFGTDPIPGVNEFQGNQTGTTFDPGTLDAGTTYYWRIDEVGSGGTTTGVVWSFTTARYLVVDDFDSYVDDSDLLTVWHDYWVNGTGAEIFIEQDANIVRDGNSLRFDYLNTYADKSTQLGSAADADIAGLDIGEDWTLGGTKALRLAFRGQAGNAITTNDKMWVQLEDTSSNSGIVIYDGDPCDVAEEEWQEWHIDLEDFNSAGVVLTSVGRIHIGFGGPQGGQSSKGGAGTVWFDDIELWAPYCRTELIPTDFTGDCVTDGLDLEEMVADWLLSDSQPNAAAPTYDPELWLKFDDGAGQTAENSGTLGTGYNGQLGNTSGTDACDPTWITTDPCADRLKCLEFDELLETHVLSPALNLNTNAATITAWVKRAGEQADNAGIVFCRGGSTVSGLGFGSGKQGRGDLQYHWDDWSWYESGLTIPDGQWTFTGLVIDPEQATLYMSDGATLDMATNVSYHGPDEWDANTSIGRDPQGGRAMNGSIDDVRIYDKSLSIAEIMGLAGIYGTVYVPLEEPTNLVPRVPDPAVDPNYYPDNPDIVNFEDYDALVDNWLEEQQLWPPD
jgi:hypothetical protein